MRDRSNKSKYHLDGVPPLGEAIPLGFQHVLAMFVGNIVPMLTVSQIQGLDTNLTTLLLQGAMFGAAIATIFTVYPLKFGRSIQIGSGLPVFMGLTYTFLPTCIAVAQTDSLGVIFGAQIIGAICSIFFGMAMKKIRRFFPNIVTGSIILSIGLSLFPMALNNMAGGIGSPTFGSYTNWLVGSIVVVTIVAFTMFGKGLLKDAAILVGIIVGYIISLVLGLVDFSGLSAQPWLSFPKPLAFGLEFRLDIVILFILIYLINCIEMMGDMSTSSVGGLGRQATDKELSGGIIGNGVASVIAAIFNCFPTGTYSQNSGIVAMTKVTSRFVIGVGAAILFVASLIPKFGAILSTIPFPVIGGATLVVFAMIAMSGLNLIASSPIGQREMLIAGISVGVGIAFVTVPDTIADFHYLFKLFFGESSIVVTAVLAIILNLALPKPKTKEESSGERASIDKSAVAQTE